MMRRLTEKPLSHHFGGWRLGFDEEVDVSSLGELRTIARQARKSGPRAKARNPDNKVAALFLAPWLIGLVFLTAGPMIASLYLSFTDYNLLKSPIDNPPPWIGLDNYREMFTDPDFWNSVNVMLLYVFISVPIQLVVALL